MSAALGDLVVRNCTPEEFKDCDIVFSGLGSDIAQETGLYMWPSASKNVH